MPAKYKAEKKQKGKKATEVVFEKYLKIILRSPLEKKNMSIKEYCNWSFTTLPRMFMNTSEFLEQSYLPRVYKARLLSVTSRKRTIRNRIIMERAKTGDTTLLKGA